MSIYKEAAQRRLRFASNRGDLLVEQLFQLPLCDNGGFDLDTLAQGVNLELKGLTEDSFVKKNTNPLKPILELKLEILKDVIKTKQEAADAATKKAEKATERRKILDAINRKKDQKIDEANLEDLEKQLAALED